MSWTQFLPKHQKTANRTEDPSTSNTLEHFSRPTQTQPTQRESRSRSLGTAVLSAPPARTDGPWNNVPLQNLGAPLERQQRERTYGNMPLPVSPKALAPAQVVDYEEPPTRSMPWPPMRMRTLIFLWVVVVLVVGIGGTVGGYFIFKSIKPKTP
ncbi:hypothetical protein B0O99DRAFT_596997 [Bisporella sp. PMI_857]|nr:hypothetical protein B0O99DRAFT_596997 [Bisporella sp. PMI_857]